MSVSKVSSGSQDVKNGAAALPKEFGHPALQQLFASGTTRGSVTGGALREAIETAAIPPARMKVVLRTLDDHGIAVTLDEETAHRAVASTTARRTTTARAKKTAAVVTTSSDDAPAAKTAAKKVAAKKVAAAVPAAEAADGATPAKKTATKRVSKAAAKKAAGAADDPAAAAGPEGDEPDFDVSEIEAEVVAEVKPGKGAPAEAAVADDDDDEDDEGTTGSKAKPAAEEESEDAGFVIRDDDEDDAPAQQVVTAGATADPVKDYLKQIGKVALLNAEQEVELAKRIEAGLFAEEKINAPGQQARPPKLQAVS